jgi:prophage antirepressor-like protein
MDMFVADRVRIYQRECDEALWMHWNKARKEPQVIDSKKSNDLQPFSFENHPVRIVLDDKMEPWWVAKDVAEALGYTWSGTSRVAHVPEQWRGVTSVVTPSGAQEMVTLSEQGLYFFLARSDKPAAIPFQMWIAGEVLPSIRRTGKYSAIPEDPTKVGLPDFNDPIAAAEGWLLEAKKRREAEAVARVAKDLARVANERARLLTAKVEDDAPKVDFSDRLQAAPTTHLVGAVAKMIQQGTKISMGQNRMFEWLRENKYLHQTGSRRNHPTQRSLDAGWFTLQVRNVEVNSEMKVKYTTRVTGKGLLHLYEHFYAMAVESGLKPSPTPPLVTSADILRQLPLWEHEDRDGVDERLVAEARRMDRKDEN